MERAQLKANVYNFYLEPFRNLPGDEGQGWGKGMLSSLKKYTRKPSTNQNNRNGLQVSETESAVARHAQDPQGQALHLQKTGFSLLASSSSQNEQKKTTNW